MPEAETELVVDASGSVHVPRITLCEGPKNISPFDFHEPWQLEHKIPMCNLSDIITTKPGDPVPVKKRLFSDKRAYILVGGVGSLGLQIAQRMYKNGAREIALTSRSGRAGILRRGDTASQCIMGIRALFEVLGERYYA
ncbi:hypothetical protein EDB19DRAFT_1949499 [Suillus lakei]|nr:hypothetical protein EDB19DRAFT_1949499 [Suillus lakei]